MKKNTTKTKLIIVILTMIAAVAAILFGTTDFYSRKNDKVIAKVNSTKIYQSEVESRLSEVMQNSDGKADLDQFPKEVLETLVKDIYLQKQLENKARKSKIAKDKNVQKKITDYTNKVLLKAYLESLIADKVNDTAVNNKYAELSNDYAGKKEMHIEHILVSSKEDAVKIAAQIKAGKSFEKLAKQYSLDKSNADLGGDLGYVIADNLDEDFAKAIDTMKKGQISAPIQTKFGWHIVKILDTRKVQMPDFTAMKPEIEARLKQDILEKMFSGITDNAKVKILINLKPQATDEKTPTAKQ